ncbi:MAG: FHA domain-containing protein [Rhodothermales bacterium]|nr:FHA domain-containing protein [Rhodothermales bacterium]
MAVKLILSNNADPNLSEEYLFDQEQITIGRDQGNDVYIVDPTRVVSKRHAEINRSSDGFVLSDLGSKNFTYLNNARIESGRTYAIDNGDTFRIGDYDLHFVVIRPEPEPALETSPPMEFDRTMFDSGFVNPFAEGAALLSQAIATLVEAYDHESPYRRDDALREAFADALDAHPHDAKTRIADILAVFRDPDATDRTPGPVPVSSNGHTATPVPREKALARRSAQPAPSDHTPRVLEVFIPVMARLLSLPWEFRHEFVGHTIAQSLETDVLFGNDKERLRRFLMDEALSDEEIERRLALVEEGADDVVLHQLAMLDGYKAVVQQGMHMMLREIDPNVAIEQLSHQGGLYRTFPKLARLVASWQLEEKFRELRGEDWSVTERRAYRPSFIRAYLARMSAGARKPQA